jgi:hypothetical protein
MDYSTRLRVALIFNHSNALSASNFNATVTDLEPVTGYPVYGFVSMFQW